MNIKELFDLARRKHDEAPRAKEHVVAARLDIDTLDECVGGRADVHGVGCYQQSAQTRVH